MSFNQTGRKLQSNGFAERFAEALRRRLAPNTTLTVQKLAGMLQKSERTVWSWLHGSGVRGEVLVTLMNLFDDDFVEEVRGQQPIQLRDETELELVRIKTELSRILAERRAR